TSQQEGHQFVIDGYDSDNYYHVNWGWGGRMNGNFLLTALDPEDQGTGGSSGNLGYNYSQDAIIGIQRPQENSERRYELYFPNYYGIGIMGISTVPVEVEQDVPFTFYCTDIIDYGNQYFDGYIGYFLVDKSNAIKEQLEVFSIEMIPGGYVYDSEGTSLVIRSAIEGGDRLQVLFSTDNENWKKVRGGAKTVDEIILRDEGGEVSVFSPEQPVPIQLSATVFDTGFYVDSEIPIYGLQFINTSGQIMKRIPVQGAMNTFVDTASLKPGLYILRIQTEKRDYHFKVIRR
ncbi:C10 family peptidase, partial [Parabacteroides sp. OttesenSCG-928-G07]|nr:C10 family peptidase [Parabacteroides sp. OttesenSCG-928-G07]